MRAILLLALLLPVAIFGRDFTDVVNVSRYTDTLQINAVIAEDAVGYSAAFSLTDGEALRIEMAVDDTSIAGFADDSVQHAWGLQLGSRVRDSAGNIDTLWGGLDFIDSLVAGSYAGAQTAGTYDSTGAHTVVWQKVADTTKVTGFAVQSRYVVPQWNELARIWVEGGGLAPGYALVFRPTIKRQLFNATRNR